MTPTFTEFLRQKLAGTDPANQPSDPVQAALIARLLSQSGQSTAPPLNQQVTGPLPPGPGPIMPANVAPSGGGVPQTEMSYAQLVSRGPGYGSQAARVASAPAMPSGSVSPPFPDIAAQLMSGPELGGIAPWNQDPMRAEMIAKQLIEDAARRRLQSPEVQETISETAPGAIPEPVKDVASTAGDVAGTVAGKVADVPIPFMNNETVGSVATKGLVKFGEVAGWAQGKVLTEMGENAYDVATGKKKDWSAEWAAAAPANWMIPGLDKTRLTYDFEAWVENPENWEAIKNAHDNGFQAGTNDPRFTGGRAVWELFINSAGWQYRTIMAIFTDPTVVLPGVAGVGKGFGSLTARAVAEGSPARAAIYDIVSGALKAPQAVADVTIDLPFNLAGKAIGKAARALPGNLFEQTPTGIVTDERAATAAALEQYGRSYDEVLADVPSMPGQLPPPYRPSADVRLYRLEPTSKTEAVILNPDGSVHSTHTFSSKYELQQVNKRVEKLNRPLIHADMAARGMELPNYEMDWMDPAYRSYVLGAKDDVLPWSITRQASEYSRISPEMQSKAKTFFRNYEEPSTRYRAERELLEAKFPGSGKGQIEKMLSEVRHFADDALPAWRDAFGDTPAYYRFRYGDELNPRSVPSMIEHAMFGTNDTVDAAGKRVAGSASTARSLLHRRQNVLVGDKKLSDIAAELSEKRGKLFGESSLSQDPAAIAKRARMQKMAPSRPAYARPKPEAVNMEGLPRREGGEDLVNVRGRVKPVGTIAPETSDLDIGKSIARADTNTRTPGGNKPKVGKTTSGQAGFRVSQGLRGLDGDPYVNIYHGKPDQKTWVVTGRDGVIAEADTLGEAITIADRQLSGVPAAKVVPAQPQLPVVATEPPAIAKELQSPRHPESSIGIVHPSVAKAESIGQRALRKLESRYGMVEGGGVTDEIAKRDGSIAGQLRQSGDIDEQTYLVVSKPIEWQQKYDVPLFEAYEQLRAEGADHATAITIINNVVHPFPGQKTDLLHKGLDGYMNVLTALREQQQYNLATGAGKMLADQLGNGYSMLVTGSPIAATKMLPYAARTWTPRSLIRRMFGRGGRDSMKHLPFAENLDRLDIVPPQSVLSFGHGMLRTESGPGQMMARKGMGKIGLDGKASGFIYGAFANQTIKDMRTALDINSRYTLYVDDLFRNLRLERERFYGIVKNRAKALGKSPMETEQWLRTARGLGDEFNARDVLNALGDERLARDWREITRSLNQRSAKRVDDVLLSYVQRNIDEKLRYAMFYHYWFSRAMIVHGRAALKNPYLLNGYFNTWQGLKNEAEERGYPRSVLGTMHFLGDAAGFYSVIDPVTMLVPFDILIESGNFDESTFDWLKNHGLFFNPLVTAAAAVFGATSQIPDVTATRQVRRGVENFIGWLNNNGYEDVVPNFLGDPHTRTGDPIDVITTRVIDNANAKASEVLGANREKFSDPRGYELDQVSSILMTNMERQFGPNAGWSDSTWNQYLDAKASIQTNSDGNNYADEALADYYDAQASTAGLKVVMPGGMQLRYGPRDSDQRLANEGYDALAANREPTAQQQAAMLKRQLAMSPSEQVTTLTLNQDAYRQYGTDRQKALSDGWNAIAYYEPTPAQDHIIVNGVLYTPADMVNMGEDGRKRLADEWVASQNGTGTYLEYKQGRDTLREGMPEYQLYLDWANTMRDAPGGVAQAREYLMKISPGYREYIGQLSDETKSDPAKFESASLSVDAYLASQGKAGSVYDLKPGDALDPTALDPAQFLPWAQGNSSSGNGSTSSYDTAVSRLNSLTKAIDKYQASLAKIDAAVMEITSGKHYSDFSGLWQTALDRQLAQRGLAVPSKPAIVANYEEWRDTLNGGEDDYVKYIEWVMSLETAQVAA